MHRRLTVVGLTADREGGGGGGRQRERRCRPSEAEVPTAGLARQANGSWEGEGGGVTASYWLKLGQVGFELEWGP